MQSFLPGVRHRRAKGIALPVRVSANTDRPCHFATWARMWAAAPKPQSPRFRPAPAVVGARQPISPAQSKDPGATVSSQPGARGAIGAASAIGMTQACSVAERTDAKIQRT